MNDLFRKFAHKTSHVVGSPWAFMTSVLVIILWAMTGPVFGYSDTWQLIINTGTTIITFLMVFLIQNTQNRDAQAIHLKLDELIRAVKDARTGLVDLEDLTDEELQQLQAEFKKLHEQYEGATHELVEEVGEELQEREAGNKRDDRSKKRGPGGGRKS